jgi:hypothetical protein
MHTPKVSVVMPVYNGKDYLREAASSVLHQTFTDFELIIINDGSTDGTPSILEEIAADKRVRVLHNEENRGLTYTRNKGIANSRGQYIAMLDSDDAALPKRIEKQVIFLDSHPEFALVGSSINLVSSDGRYIRTQYYPTPPAYIPSLLLFQNNFAQSTVMLRRSALPAECYRLEYPPAEDYDLWVRMAANHKVANLDAALVKYRIHGASISTVQANTQQQSIHKIQAAQLSQIGVAATADELRLHAQIGVLEVPGQKSAILKVEEWLLRLTEANRLSGYYTAPIFNKIVAQKWFEVCRSSGLGGWAYRKMVASPLFSVEYASFILQSKFVSKVRAKVER